MYFDNYPATVVHEPGTINVYYGGVFRPGGDGHGHVKAQGGTFAENIVYWRLPLSEGGTVVIDNWASTERLADHMSGLY